LIKKKEKKIMSKEWGTTTPNISKYVKAVPTSATDLLAKLKSMAENWKYVDKCGVIKSLKGIYVDLGDMANNGVKVFGKVIAEPTPDFYIPIKIAEIDKADTLVRALNAKADTGKPVVEQDAIALFATVETA
jgi:hypothetical protein